jgi:tetratricopeptide (TPR) repeat protein
VAASALVVAGLLAVAIRCRKGPIGVGLAWWAGMLVPVLVLVQVGSQSLADRYMLLPSIGLTVALVFAPSAKQAQRLFPLACCAVLLLGWRSHVQGRTWRDSRSLFEHAVTHTRDNWLAWNNLGNALRAAGDAQGALAAYDASLRIQPDYASAHYNRANALVDLRQLAAAEAGYRSTLRLDPKHSGARVNLARVCLATERPQEAVTLLREALALSPADLATRLNLAQALHGLGQLEEAKSVLDGADAAQWAAAPPAVRQRELALRQRLGTDTGTLP